MNVFPVIVCKQRCVVFGWVEKDPVVGKPVTLRDARMILRWTRIGLFGTAQQGPAEGSRLTHAIPETTMDTCTEVVHVSPEAAERLDEWPAYEG